ncbi:MAG: CopG family antitoxin [Caldilineaceae bacterium]|nr:CopG family antitoxin [Caldilineaceae bacterium]
MSELKVPDFKSYEEEAEFWDNLDTADLMEDDGEWFRFDTPQKRAVRVAILPEIAEELMRSAHAKGVSIETLVNVLLIERIQGSTAAS